jgi:hypothetical protein
MKALIEIKEILFLLIGGGVRVVAVGGGTDKCRAEFD